MTERYLAGLDDREVAESRALHGSNVLTPPEKEPLWMRFLSKFRDPLIIILMVAGLLSVGISVYEYCVLHDDAGVFFEPVGIFVAILLATGLSFVFELKADREFELLNQVNDDEPVQAIRCGHAVRIARRDVVVGDVVLINTGDEIPADGVLLESVLLSVDESTLTGEPLCHKWADSAKADPDATFPSDHVLRGTRVMEGHGVMRVTAVGDMTENGKVFKASQIDPGVKTPLDEQLERLGKLITVVSYLIAVAVVVGRMTMYISSVGLVDWIHAASYLLKTLMVAVTLIVVAVPEGLPMAVTLSLAYSMRRMLRTNNLVRKLHACETMGAATVICTDKTGTLTQNRMKVHEARFFVADADLETVYEGMALNSTAMLDMSGDKPQVLGNPTEGALLLWLKERGYDHEIIRSHVKRASELPFTTERKYMATEVVRHDGTRMLHVKGAPEIVLGMCAGFDGSEVAALLSLYQRQAMRTLGFAYCRLSDGDEPFEEGRVVAGNLVFAGVAAISDPVRDDVADAVSEVSGAGIKVKIVTGDTPLTAKEIGRQIGMWDDVADGDANIITGPEFAALSDEEVSACAEDIKIIARARPLDKKRLVEALQSAGEIVAVTGDGTNDAPALKTAHVGLSMGDGTAVAKEASDITIIDNSFSSIVRAVVWGRSLYRNIQRFILFQMTVNVVACLIVLCGSFMGMESPLSVTQMLWVNLIMDTFAAMALASLPPSESVMMEKPRSRGAFIISRAMWRSIIGVGGAFFVILLALLYWLEHYGVSGHGAEFLSAAAPHGLDSHALSIFFTVFVFLQFWNMFNAKAFASGRSALHFKECSGFVAIASLIFAGQIIIVTFGGKFFNVEPLRLSEWAVIIASTSLVLWIGEAMRLLGSRRSAA